MRSLSLRDETPPDDHVVVLRGGIIEHRTDDELRSRAKAAEARIGLVAPSVFLASEAHVHSICEQDARVSRYPKVSLATLARLRRAGSALLPTLDEPHYSVVLPDLNSETLQRFRSCFDPAQSNPPPTLPDDHAATHLKEPRTFSRFEPDIIIDYLQVGVDGVIAVDTVELPEGTNEQDRLVVGDHDAEPAVVRVLKIRPDRTSILVLPGAADGHAALLKRRSATPTA